METSTQLLAGIAGFMIGLLIWSRSVRWVQTVWGAIRQRRDRGDWFGLLVVVFFHSGPWLLGISTFLAVRILSAPYRPEWANSFFVGALVVPVFIAINVFVVLWRQRKIRNASIQP